MILTTLKAKLIAIFALVAVTLGGLLAIQVVSSQRSQGAYEQMLELQVEEQIHALEIEVNMLNARRAEKDFLARKDVQYIEKVNGYVSNIVEIAEELREHAVRADDGTMVGMAAQMLVSIVKYKQAFLTVSNAWIRKGLDETAGLQGSFRDSAHALEEAVANYPELMVDYLMLRRHEKDYLLRGAPKYVDRATATVSTITQKLPEFIDDENTRGTVVNLLDTYQSDFLALVAQDSKIIAETEIMRDAVHEIEPITEEALLHAATTLAASHDEVAAQAARTMLISIVLFAVVLILLSVIFIGFSANVLKQVGGEPGLIAAMAKTVAEGDFAETDNDGSHKKKPTGIYAALDDMIHVLKDRSRTISRIAAGDMTEEISMISDRDGLGEALMQASSSLNEVLSEVNNAVAQVTSGAEQISQAGQTLSQGAAEQASSLEEVSSSLAEINSQARQNAEIASEASSLAKTALQNAGEGNDKMQGLIGVMTKIDASSEEITKVVKLIDDIAFQINLLALNANVEAARAGKYGKGFAVVAEEVRNLAVRSAGAVKETTGMVDDTNKNIAEGAKAVQATADQLEEIVGGASKVSEFLEEIALLSNEQARGVEQINSGLEQIDQVTQSNTASAEESASASEELSSQALALKDMVAKFKLKAASGKSTALITGVSEKAAASTIPIARQKALIGEAKTEPAMALAAAGNGNGNGKKHDSKDTLSLRPDEIIRLD